MTHRHVELCGVPISRLGLQPAIAWVNDQLAAARGGYGCFVNAHTLTEATKHVALREALAGASFRFADGRPLLWLARLKNQPIAGRVCGPDFMSALLRCRPDITHGFIGGPPGCAGRIARRFGVHGIAHSPPIREFSEAAAREDWQHLLGACREPPPLVWVGLGAPKQERWMAAVSTHAPRTLFLGVGAAFDFLAGTKPRAPQLLQDVGLEWAHRLASEPRRLWRRYLITNAKFIGLAMRDVRSVRAE